jgi:hypothetical protein
LIAYSCAGQLFDFDVKGIRAGKLIGLHGCAKTLELKLRNAARDELTVISDAIVEWSARARESMKLGRPE